MSSTPGNPISPSQTAAQPTTTTTPAPKPTAEEVVKLRKKNADRLVESLLSRMKSSTVLGDIPVSPLAVTEGEMFKLTHTELQAIVDKHPDHPIAKEYAAALLRSPSDEHPLVVERIHIEAIVDNKGVETEEVTEVRDGKQTRVHRRRLVSLPQSTSV